jgi:thiamine biosynthesis protein ThiS
MSGGSLKIKLNGEEREFESAMTLGDLLKSLGLNEKAVFIEYNLEPLERLAYSGTTIKDGDNIEIVTMMAGG